MKIDARMPLALLFVVLAFATMATLAEAQWRNPVARAEELARQAGEKDAQGMLSEAARLYGEAAGVIEDVSGEEELRGNYLFNVGNIRLQLKQNDQALKAFQGAVPAYEKALGSMNEKVADALHGLGAAAWLVSNYDLATTALERALRIREQMFGETHLVVANTLNDLSAVHQQAGRPNEALAGYRRARVILEMIQAVPESFITNFSNSANALVSLNHAEEAEKIYLRLIQLGKPQMSRAVVTSIGNLAVIYREQGRDGDSKARFIEALEYGEQVVGRQADQVKEIARQYVVLLRKQRDFQEVARIEAKYEIAVH